MQTSDETQALPSLTIDEAIWRGEVTAELRHIHLGLCTVQSELHELRNYVAGELSDHRAYHARNEVRWGPMRWCERHPFQLAVLVLGAGASITLYRAGVEWLQIVTMLAQIAK